MQQVRHDRSREFAVLVEELRVDVQKKTVLSSASLAMSLLASVLTLRSWSLLSAPRGKMASTSTFVRGSLVRTSSMSALTPTAMSSGELLPELFVPIIRTANLGEMPSILPLSQPP